MKYFCLYTKISSNFTDRTIVFFVFTIFLREFVDFKLRSNGIQTLPHTPFKPPYPYLNLNTPVNFGNFCIHSKSTVS